LFEAKWGYRTMGHWLHAFRVMGLIDDTPDRPIRIRRHVVRVVLVVGEPALHPGDRQAALVEGLAEIGVLAATSTAWCATPSCSRPSGATAPWGTGSTPSG
jgi:hypothetical protein